MNYRIFFSTFALVFLAELGDKTQLTSFTLAANAQFPWSVFAGAAAAFLLSTAIAVAASDFAIKVFGPKTLKIVSAALFIGFGIWMLVSTLT